MKYSIIIPVYNSAKTIRRCLESLLDQRPTDTEILVINDGSEDDSGEICKEYMNKNSCIKYYEKENGGVSSARNLGIEKSIGEYILFVDSDDYVAVDYFETLDREVELRKPDMLLFSVQYIGKSPKIWTTGDYVVKEQKEVVEKIDEALRQYLFSTLMSKMFCRRIIQKYNIKFDESLFIGEDQAFIFEYAMHINEIISISDVLYYYVMGNENSLSCKRRDYLSEQLLKVNMKMLSAVNMSGFSKELKRILYSSVVWVHYRSAYSSCKEILKFNLKRSERKKKIKQICKMYNIKAFQPLNFKEWMIALPIIFQMYFFIDILICRKYEK